MSRILAVCTDLFFAVKIQDAGKRAGREVRFFKSSGALVEAAREGAGLIVLDLNCRDVDSLAVLSALQGDPALAAIPSLGFLSHVQVDLRQRALDLGCDTVVPRSAFSDHAVRMLSVKSEAAQP